MANNLETIFAALGDPTRRAVVEQLTKGSAAVSELHAAHDLALPTFLRHLRVLENAGLVTSEKIGRVRTVHIEAAALGQINDWLDRQHALLRASVDRLAILAEGLEHVPSRHAGKEAQ